MREKRVIILSLIVMVAFIVCSTAYLFVSDTQINLFDNLFNDGIENDSVNVTNPIEIEYVTFYSDGNPNTGESATINVGAQHQGEVIQVSTAYSRDGRSLNTPVYENKTVDSEGNVEIYAPESMRYYPDYCVVNIRNDYTSFTGNCSLGKYTGYQTVYV